ncbi:lysophospholipid acyltransferase family protein [Wenxinia marina]|uniref:Lauroyl/myristoyl acyltransferase n=1 Tax=Wenxinia marina DSM 24838 TaxID=1123501 RepID=A0A0D0Q9C0_9RHOB|nr:lysophospholipid acyltransferase family protein [Wenxinia marina]KIQ68967.1 Lauroyl/myristoyl acyltransferase [Wenxinia marina DSM 24838]
MAGRETPTLLDRVGDGAFRALLRRGLAMPYERRIAAAGRLGRRLGGVAGYRARAMEQLALARPDLSPQDRRRIADEAIDNAARSLIEHYSAGEFAARTAARDPLTGPGLPALLTARDEGRPAILAPAHFGNFMVFRTALTQRGVRLGVLYRPMNNPLFESHYRPAMEAISTPLFPRDRAGTAAMVRHLRGGGIMAIAPDQYVKGGAPLTSFGLPARTTLSPAELALRYDAPLFTAHAIRQPDGLSFEARIDEPVPQSTPEEMMQEVNDRFEAVIRRHMGQWMWFHRRWKA